jgi:hypothetical protein
MQHRTSAPRVTATVVVAAVTFLLLLSGAVAAPAGAQGDDPAVQTDDTTVQTTSTLPIDNREIGNSLPRPGQGREPQSPGDPGGWLQTSLFFLICGAILVIVGLVWRSSRRARERRTAEGHDPVQMATARGEGLRPTATASTVSEPQASDAT